MCQPHVHVFWMGEALATCCPVHLSNWHLQCFGYESMLTWLKPGVPATGSCMPGFLSSWSRNLLMRNYFHIFSSSSLAISKKFNDYTELNIIAYNINLLQDNCNLYNIWFTLVRILLKDYQYKSQGHFNIAGSTKYWKMDCV